MLGEAVMPGCVVDPAEQYLGRRRQHRGIDQPIAAGQLPKDEHQYRHHYCTYYFHLTPTAALALASRSSLTKSAALGAAGNLPTPYLTIKSAVTWTCSAVMSYVNEALLIALV